MALLEVCNLSHSFGDKLLYKDVSFDIYKGEHVGLIGKNGTGKSTLMNLLIGNLVPDKGQIRWQKGIRLGYLDQYIKIDNDLSISNYLKCAFNDLYEIEEKLNKLYDNMCNDMSEESLKLIADYQSLLENRGFYEIESNILKVCAGLGIVEFGMETELSKLSGGQRARVILAKLLLENPEMLLLDEPTNFLDVEHIKWLTDYLKGFTGTYIVISHDFDFLNDVTNCILDIEFCILKKYAGNLYKFLEIKGIQRESYIREYSAQQKKIKKLEDYISKNKVRASTSKMAKSRQKQLDKMDRLIPPQGTSKPIFNFTFTSIGRDKTLIVENLEIGYSYPLLPKLNFDILSKEKVVIEGFNGVGKTTLIKTLISEIPPISGKFRLANDIKIGYFEQSLKWKDNNISPMEILKQKFPRLSDKDIRSHLAKSGLKADHVLREVSSLSGGEQTKVKLSILSLIKCNFLILDEPTNHLDTDAKESLKEALTKWDGTLIIVSHEPAFYKGWTDKVINIEYN